MALGRDWRPWSASDGYSPYLFLLKGRPGIEDRLGWGEDWG